MEKSAPTRQQFLLLKGRHYVVSRGMGLLKSKREALMKEFFGVIEECVRLRQAMTGLIASGQRSVTLAGALYGTKAIESFAHASRREVSLEIKLKNIWGVNVPEIAEVSLTRTLEARDTSPVMERPLVLKAAGDFERAGDVLVKIASKEARLTRLGEVIKADTRKINALSEVVLPSIRRRIKEIERALEEREREEAFRQKRFKEKRSAMG